ncbi:MAG: phosphate/phosphite/phosphonate ABC transporter substrate-binding protein [Gammaproteobacteria bacterium]|nr:phosphate/phosphite/phosphonate ABC transporter substrate-binding protein [Gammaproteobacteria bacterium]
MSMVRGLLSALNYSLALVLTITSVPVNAATDDALVLGLLPRRNPSEMVEMFQPLAAYLSRELGLSVKLETSPTFPEFAKAIENKRFDIVHFNQMQYVRAHKLQGYTVVAMNEEAHRANIRSTIVVRKDSSINTFADLRGTTIIFGDREAFAAYILPTYLLRNSGLTAKDYKEEFAVTPSNVPLAVFYRHADAGGTGDHLMEMPWLKEKIDVNQLRLIGTGDAVPHLPWAVSPKLSTTMQEKIRTALIRLKKAPDGDAILKTANLTNIVPAKDSDYDVVRRILEQVTSGR